MAWNRFPHFLAIVGEIRWSPLYQYWYMNGTPIWSDPHCISLWNNRTIINKICTFYLHFLVLISSRWCHMIARAHQITDNSTVFFQQFVQTNIKNQRSALLALLCEGNHSPPVDPPHKGSIIRKLFSFYCVLISIYHRSDRAPCNQFQDRTISGAYMPSSGSTFPQRLARVGVTDATLGWISENKNGTPVTVVQSLFSQILCAMDFEMGALLAMMTSSNGNIFRLTGHLCGEFTGPRWIPHTKVSDVWCFLWSAAPEYTVE